MKYINKLGLILSISDILKLNQNISESDKYKLIFNPENLSDLFENSNNSLDEIFLYGVYDEITESLYNDYYGEYYYELYSINSAKYKFMRIESIYELINIVLNHLKHYNLNNSFKFDKSCYELY